MQILCLFNRNQTPRSDSVNLEPSEPIFCPQIMGPRHCPTRELAGDMWDADAAANPEFAGAAHVYVPYCSSDSWCGAAWTNDDEMPLRVWADDAIGAGAGEQLRLGRADPSTARVPHRACYAVRTSGACAGPDAIG